MSAQGGTGLGCQGGQGGVQPRARLRTSSSSGSRWSGRTLGTGQVSSASGAGCEQRPWNQVGGAVGEPPGARASAAEFWRGWDLTRERRGREEHSQLRPQSRGVGEPSFGPVRFFQGKAFQCLSWAPAPWTRSPSVQMEVQLFVERSTGRGGGVCCLPAPGARTGGRRMWQSWVCTCVNSQVC